jgi:hypothetical protein
MTYTASKHGHIMSIFFPSLSCFLLVLIMVIRILWYVWFVFWFDTKLNLNMNLYCVSILDMKLILNLDSLRFKSQFESWFDNHVCDNWGVQSIHVESWKLILVIFNVISVTNWNFWTFGSWVAASDLLFWKQTVWTFFVALIHQSPETTVSFCCLSVMFKKFIRFNVSIMQSNPIRIEIEN